MSTITTTAEATAPTRIDLAGGTVAAAIDRRVYCRVDAGGEGVCLESKDSLVKLEGRDVAALPHTGTLALVVQVLDALGIESGVKVVTHSRVPTGSGLGEMAALTVAVVAAVSRAVGRALDAEALVRIAREAESRVIGTTARVQDYLAAVHGGVLESQEGPGEVLAKRLATDPGRVEESLLLVDAGSGPIEAAILPDRSEIASLAARLAEALVAHRYDDVPGLIDAEWEARKSLAPGVTSPAIDRVVDAARAHGGAARACGGTGSLVTVWCAPGRRPGLAAALAAGGARLLTFRLDLRGLEVE